VLDLERLQQDREDQRVDRHQRQRIDKAPDQAEDRATVFPVELAPEDVHEQIRVADDIGVEAHDSASVGADL
jgi:division protein CdvB (Snf7/Vps24/ESCRT-III family)